ncbi:MAG TPA: MOSC domain-containing protein [Luteitalea sp.]|nr:MOSC domain-containing protein [Luteitalea sp.]
MTNTKGRVAQLWIKRNHRGRMDEATEVTLVEGEGVQGSADRKGARQVTILSAERWARLADQIGTAPDPVVRRANVLVAGLELPLRRGSILCLGTTRIRIKGETRPCERMDEAVPGLRAAMREDLGGGLYGEVVAGGRLSVGDEVAWADDAQLSLLDGSEGA